MIIKNKSVQLYINEINNNEDGSFTIKMGIFNPNFKAVKIDNINVQVIKGAAIILKLQNNIKIESGYNESLLVVVINNETRLEWTSGSQKLLVDGKKIDIQYHDSIEKNLNLDLKVMFSSKKETSLFLFIGQKII